MKTIRLRRSRGVSPRCIARGWRWPLPPCWPWRWVSRRQSQALTININAGAGLAGNAGALAAWDRAASQWESIFTDPVLVTIDADLADLAAGILGQASSVTLFGSYDLDPQRDGGGCGG